MSTTRRSARESRHRNILFLYATALVPDPVLRAARDGVPEGFTLTLCNSDVDEVTRREHVRSANFVMLYGMPFGDVDAARNVGLLQLLSAGYDRLDLDGLAAAGIPVADNGGANAQTVAEHTVLLMLAVLKRLTLHHQALVGGEWLGLSKGVDLRELCGKQVGIVGFGRIGQRVARMVSAFDARPVYTDIEDTSPLNGGDARRLPFDKLLATSDIVTLHTPLTSATRHLIGTAELESMQPHAILVNTARGEVVDEAALIDALMEGRIGGAGLDVFEREPVSPDSPLLGMDNVVVSPHVAGTTLDTWSRRLAFAFANIDRVAAGERAESLVG